MIGAEAGVSTVMKSKDGKEGNYGEGDVRDQRHNCSERRLVGFGASVV